MTQLSTAFLVICSAACVVTFEFGLHNGSPASIHRVRSLAQNGPPSGNPPSGTPPSGTPPSGTPPSGTPPSGTPPGCESGSVCTPPPGPPPSGAGGPPDSTASTSS